MKLKTVPKIRTDCMSCNGDSSVRQVVSDQSSMSRATCGEYFDSFHSLRINSVEPIRESGNKEVAGPVKQPAVATGFKRNHWSDEFALPHVDVAVDSEDTAEVGWLGWWLLGVPQREVLRNNTGTRISLYGKYEVVPSFGISVYPLHCRMWEQLTLKTLRQWAVRVLLNVNKRN